MARPDTRTLWLVGPIALALAPHALFLPLWVSGAAGMALLWRLTPFWRKDAAGQRILRLLLALLGVAGVFLEHRTLFGPQGGVSLLVLMTVLKLLEAEGRRDHGIMVLIGYFLLMTTFISDQSLAMAAWLLAVAIALTASLVVAQSTHPPRLASALKIGASLSMQALPLALLLFVLFPRLPNPIGGLIQTQQSRSGLSDSMSPGSVSELILSDAIAFRIDFTTPGVDGRRLYWRGPVLWDYDGRTWRRSPYEGETPDRAGLGQRLSYSVTLEAHRQNWLFITGLPSSPPSTRADMLPSSSADLEWQTSKPVLERLRYQVSAWPEYRLETDLDPQRRAQALALPEGYNPRTRALGERWANETALLGNEQTNEQATEQANELVRRALAFFRQEAFYYTLRPPRLGEHAVDEFLFSTRRGVCEHYASAVVSLMRAAGVPARVVTGYQGGERNPVGDYWIVRQRDAHAWTEVWLAGRGWVLVDPTAAVAPQRIEQGISAALPMAEQPLLQIDADWLRPARQAWDFLNNGWNQWVLGYDFERQRRFLDRLHPSLGQLKGMLWTLLIGIGLLFTAFFLLAMRPGKRPPSDEVSRLYARFRRRLATIGLPASPSEGPSDFARRAAHARPDLAAALESITALYIGLRYGDANRDRLKTLRQQVRAFHPGKKKPG